MKKILITGAAGFVGSRLVEILKEQHNAEVNILIRNISSAARISRYKLNYFQGNICDETVMDVAMKDCDTVVHCAHDFSSDEINLQAADLIANLCIKHKIKRLVYISTSAVHFCESDKFIDENSTKNLSWSYSVNKLQVEEKLLEHNLSQQLPVIILRPSIIYGPFAGVWTNGFVKDMLESRVVLPFNGKRICNAVYIDDVVQAIIKAIQAPQEKTGQAYLVSGSDRVTWHDFFSEHKNYPGVQSMVLWNDEQSLKWYEQLKDSQVTEVKPSLLKDPITYLKSKYIYKIYKQLLKNKFIKNKLLSTKSKIPRPLKYPSAESFETLGCATQIDIRKIQTDLNYKPEYNFSDGMRKTKVYLAWYNLKSSL